MPGRSQDRCQPHRLCTVGSPQDLELPHHAAQAIDHIKVAGGPVRLRQPRQNREPAYQTRAQGSSGVQPSRISTAALVLGEIQGHEQRVGQGPLRAAPSQVDSL